MCHKKPDISICQYLSLSVHNCKNIFSQINLCFAFLDQMVLHYIKRCLLINLMNISVSIQMITFHVVDGQEIMVLVVSLHDYNFSESTQQET